MKKKTIFQNQSQDLYQLFEEDQNHRKVLCVPIDYTKKDHPMMFCNGYGDISRKPFDVKNFLGDIEHVELRESLIVTAQSGLIFFQKLA